MKGSIFVKLIVASTVLIAITALSLNLLIRNTWQSSLQTEIERSLAEKTHWLADRAKDSPEAGLSDLARVEAKASNARVTIIDSNGKALADSEGYRQEGETYAAQPEFQTALRGQTGIAVRSGGTETTLYVAVAAGGRVARMALPLVALRRANGLVWRKLFAASLVALLIAGVAAAYLTPRISDRLLKVVHFGERIAAGDLTARIDDNAPDEIGDLALALNRMADSSRNTIQSLRERGTELESLLNSMQDAVIAVNEQSRVKWANGAMKRLAGTNITQGAPLINVIRNPDVLNTIRETLASLSMQKSKVHFSSGRIFDVTVGPMPGGAVIVFQDVTEIERIEKTRRDFIANVSHELRTPLTSIQGYTETLLDSPSLGKAEVKEFLRIIMKNASRMARLTDDLLKLASVESGETKLRLQATSVPDLLKDAEQIAKERGISARVENGVQDRVMCDREALHQVFTNLIENARKYAKGSQEIVVRANDGGGSVEFSVTDFGPGIASEHLPRLFERFYRVDKARSLEAGGTGLGLAIMKHIVLAHGGSVRVESELNRGATFFFSVGKAPLAGPTQDFHQKLTSL